MFKLTASACVIVGAGIGFYLAEIAGGIAGAFIGGVIWYLAVTFGPYLSYRG